MSFTFRHSNKLQDDLSGNLRRSTRPSKNASRVIKAHGAIFVARANRTTRKVTYPIAAKSLSATSCRNVPLRPTIASGSTTLVDRHSRFLIVVKLTRLGSKEVKAAIIETLRENTNGLLREYFKKGYDFSNLSDEDLQAVVDQLNHRPRKCLGYRTPAEVYFSVALNLTIQAL